MIGDVVTGRVRVSVVGEEPSDLADAIVEDDAAAREEIEAMKGVEDRRARLVDRADDRSMIVLGDAPQNADELQRQRTVEAWFDRERHLKIQTDAPLVGSSRNMMVGLASSSIAMQTRLRSPPETPRSIPPPMRVSAHLSSNRTPTTRATAASFSDVGISRGSRSSA